jgi:putative methanogenesis marker protein 17
MEIEIISDDKIGAASYETLFTDIMADIGKLAQIEKAILFMKPEDPLFVFSVKLRSEPVSKTIGDVANVRTEGDIVHLTITDEKYAPNILDQLWKKYGRNAVDQQTRFDMDVDNADEKIVKELQVASGEEHVSEMVGALWRILPEGIKNRHTLIDGTSITVIATEEILQPYMIEKGEEIHKKMRGA